MPPDKATSNSMDEDLAQRVEHLNLGTNQENPGNFCLIELKIKVKGRYFMALIDTGASRTFVSRSMVDKCQLQVDKDSPETQKQVKLADSSALGVEGTAQL
ncbi:uncharacterized protein UTRI_04672 [Ustilago trichophora]|uniref:Uncharacterized protein n=1 Tax=Ustilago trichophora TaxID=86804 RepID=A0A5C3EE13_9BASI|nr:uncharacterized protein UTRI_04672 [Ustilago trichophora]